MTYYFDSVNGDDANLGTSPEEAWQTRDKWVAEFNADRFQPGDTIVFVDGSSWAGPGTDGTACLNVLGSYTEAAPLTLTRTLDGAAPVFSNPGSASNWTNGINVQVSWVTLDGLHVTDCHYNGVNVYQAATGVVIDGCEIDHCGQGVTLEGQGNIVEGCHIHDGTMVVNDASPDNDFGAVGVALRNGYNVVRHCLFERCRAESIDYGHDGGVIEVWVPSGRSVVGVEVYGNLAVECESVFEFGGGGGRAIADFLSHHNIWADCGGWFYVHNSSSSPFHITLTGAQFHHDLWVDTAPWDPYHQFVFGAWAELTSAQLEMRNCIIDCLNFYHVLQPGRDGGYTHDHNLYYRRRGEDTDLNFTPGPTEPEGDPLYLDLAGGDYHLQAGSPAVDAGADLGYSGDFEGGEVPQGDGPDIGPYELPDEDGVIVERQVGASADDAGEKSNGTVSITEAYTTIYLTANWMGARFTDVTVPPGATILHAYLYLRPTNTNYDSPAVRIYAQDTDDAGAFAATANNISNRPRTAAYVDWDEEDVGTDFPQSPDIAAVIGEVVGRPGWASGNALALLVQGLGIRNQCVIYSYDGSPSSAARLHIEYTEGAGQNFYLSGQVGGSTDVAAGLSPLRALTGQAEGNAIVYAALHPTRGLAGSVGGQAALEAGLRAALRLSGQAEGDSSLAVELAVLRRLAGAVPGRTDSAAALRAVLRLAGEASGATAVAAALSPLRGLAGSVTGGADLLAGLRALRNLGGQIEGTGSLAATLHRLRVLSGQIAGSTAVTGELGVLGSVYLAGQMAGSTDLSVGLRLALALAGQGDGATQVAAQLHPYRGLAGQPQGSTDVVAALHPERGLAGSIHGQATVAAVLTALCRLEGSVQGSTEASAQQRLLLSLAGAIAGGSDVAAVLTVVLGAPLVNYLDAQALARLYRNGSGLWAEGHELEGHFTLTHDLEGRV